MDLYTLFKDYPDTLGSKNFSEFLLNESSLSSIMIDYVAYDELYNKARELCLGLGDYPHKETNLKFINNGLEFSAQKRANDHQMINFSANAAFMINLIFENASYPKPDWLPETFFISSPPGSSHVRTYLYVWSTVSPRSVPLQKTSSLVAAVKRYAKKHELDGEINPLREAMAKKNNVSSPIARRPLAKNPDLSSTPMSATSADVPKVPFTLNNSGFVEKEKAPEGDAFDLNLLAVTLYLNTLELCRIKEIPMSLSIVDVYNLVKESDKCFFTDGELAKCPSTSMSDYQICLRRKLESGGFSPENTVACSHQAAKVLANFDGLERENTFASLKSIHNSGLDLNMLKMLNGL
jgi:hypothetical protein